MSNGADIFDLVMAAILPGPNNPSPTDAEGRIARPGQTATQADQYPRIKARMLGETKQSQGRGSVGFTTTIVIRLVAEASAPVNPDDVTVSEIEDRLWRLKRQMEVAIINSSPLFGVIQQLASVQTQMAFDAQATMLAGLQSDWTFEFYEDETDFAPIIAEDLAGVDAHLPAGGPGFST